MFLKNTIESNFKKMSNRSQPLCCYNAQRTGKLIQLSFYNIQLMWSVANSYLASAVFVWLLPVMVEQGCPADVGLPI